MQAKERRQALLLGALLLVLVVVVWRQFGAGSSPATLPAASDRATRPAATRAPGRAASTAAAGPIVVNLAWLGQPLPEPMVQGRDPFVFGAARSMSPVPPPEVPGAEVAGPDAVVGPPEPPPPPPIPYRFIGVLDAPGTGQVAVLSDGRFVYHGREGDIIDGRYRLVSVSGSSVQLEYLDGRGRQTLRLSGS